MFHIIQWILMEVAKKIKLNMAHFDKFQTRPAAKLEIIKSCFHLQKCFSRFPEGNVIIHYWIRV